MHGSGPHFSATCLALYELGRANYAFVTLALRPGTSTRRPYARMVMPVKEATVAVLTSSQFMRLSLPPPGRRADGISEDSAVPPPSTRNLLRREIAHADQLSLVGSLPLLGLLHHRSVGRRRGHGGRVPVRHPAGLRAARPSARGTRAAGARPLGGPAADAHRHRARARPRRRPLFAQAHLPAVAASDGTPRDDGNRWGAKDCEPTGHPRRANARAGGRSNNASSRWTTSRVRWRPLSTTRWRWCCGAAAPSRWRSTRSCTWAASGGGASRRGRPR